MTTSEAEQLLIAKLLLEIAADYARMPKCESETERLILAAHSYIQAATYGIPASPDAQEMHAKVIANATVCDAAADPTLLQGYCIRRQQK